MKLNQKLIKDLKECRVVLHNEPKNPETALEIIVATGKSRTWFDGRSTYYYNETSGMMYGCSRLDLLPKLPIVPISDFLLPEQFTVGKEYEIKYNIIDQEWIKGKLLAIVDHDTHKYVVTTEDIPYPSGCAIIRPIQPKEIKITRWINMSQSGNQVGKKCFESEMEACQHAPMSQKVFQVKLTGTYTI